MTPKQKWIAFLTLLRREVQRMLRLWPQTLLPSAITTVLYFLIFGNVIGARIGQMEGYNYASFIAPGLIMLAIITGAFSGVVASFFSMKFIRSIEELLVSPMPTYVILLGFMVSGVARGVLSGALVAIIALCFTHLHIHSLWVTLAVTVLASCIFSLAGLINAVYAKKFDDIVIVPTFILTPLTYLGGVFYSIGLLPPVWRVVSHFNPIVYIIDTFRFGILGIGAEFVVSAFVVMIVLTAVLYLGCLYLLERGTGLRE